MLYCIYLFYQTKLSNLNKYSLKRSSQCARKLKNMHEVVLVDFENIKRGKERKNWKNRNLKKAIIINLFVKAGAPQKITISISSYLSYLVSIFHLCSCLSTFTSVLHVNKCIWYNFLVWWFSLCGGKKHPSLFLWLSDAKKVSIGDVILNLHRIWITEEKEIKRGDWTIVPFAGHSLFLTCFHFDFFLLYELVLQGYSFRLSKWMEIPILHLNSHDSHDCISVWILYAWNKKGIEE